MAALVQSYPQQSGTVTMLQTRSTSSQAQSGQQYSGLPQQRNGYHAVPGAPLVYRGSSTPIQPYAFTSTPSLNSSAQWQQFSAYRTSSTPAVPTMQSFDGNNAGGRSRYPASASMNNLPIIQTSASLATSGSRDDSSLPAMGRRVAPAPRPQSSYMASPSTQLSFPPPQAAPARPSPERYRRPQPRSAEAPAMGQQGHHQMSAMPSGSGMATVNHLYNTPRKLSPSLPSRPNSYYGNVPGSAVDDISLHRQQSQEAKRVRRCSMPALDSADYPNPLTPPDLRQPEESSRLGQLTPPETTDKEQIKIARIVSISAAGANAMHARNGSSESLVSSRSSHSRPSSSANRNTTNVSTPTGNPAQLSTLADQNSSSPDYPKLVNIPPRSSSSDAAKRIANPSPLSKPVTMEGESETAGSVAANGAATSTQAPPAASSSHHTESPAVKQLAAISQKGGKLRSKTSRLRRAFSFGSAAELRNAGVTQDSGDASSQGPSKLHKEPTPEELYDAEQARIAEQQEAAGIGNSIYGAKLFSGSTDNLSISSTASSASIMIRKMGRGMKKGGRSLVGLFRPKSVIGVPPADAPVPEASQATVSMITVEAERERVNVNADPHSQNGGGTGFPRLERNSIDASKAPSLGSERLGSSGTDSAARKSIVGGEKERAEVLAAVRKGILKNTSGSSSPSARPVDSRNPAFDLPAVPHVSDSPISSAPSTPTEEAQGHKRTSSVAIGSEDYFMTALRLRQDTKSAPTTPQGTLKRNATFSPRIVFYDTWPSQEYDRRGEIATCNRLTPMLAQQIKEELNTFKMEMEVHENSKIYTHFF